jgi:RNA recognition motif-containing protein
MESNKIMKKLYVGNLSRSTSEEGLKSFFNEFGPLLSCTIIRDAYSHESRGFGFIELEDGSKAEAAIKTLNAANLDGNELIVNEARPKGGERSGGGGSHFGGGSRGGPRGGGDRFGGGGRR